LPLSSAACRCSKLSCCMQVLFKTSEKRSVCVRYSPLVSPVQPPDPQKRHTKSSSASSANRVPLLLARGQPQERKRKGSRRVQNEINFSINK
jgi:hypothetical protein